jgi:hypothetical protein
MVPGETSMAHLAAVLGRHTALTATAIGVVLTVAPARGGADGFHVFVVPAAQQSGIIAGDLLEQFSGPDQAAALPFVLPPTLTPPAEPAIPPYPAYCIDPMLPADEQAALITVMESLRLTPTGRCLYAFVRRRFGPLSGSLRSLTLTLASMGDGGDMAVTSGLPPRFQVTLNRQFLAGGGPGAMVPKLGHELVHVRDFVDGQLQSVALEVSAHAADMALTYEINAIAGQPPDGGAAAFNSLLDVYRDGYVPYRQAATREAYGRYWQALMSGVCERRPYRNLYRDADGQTLWNSPPGPPTGTTYVPYDPAFGVPDVSAP